MRLVNLRSQTLTLSRTWQRIAIILCVLTLSVWMGRRPSVLSIALVVVAIGSAVLMSCPELGLIGFLMIVLTVPFAVGTGTQTALNAGVLVAPLLLAVWVLEMVRMQNVKLAPSPVNTPVLVFAASATLSFVSGNLRWNLWADPASLQAQLGGWMVMVLSAGVFLLVGNQIKDIRWLKILTGIVLAAGALYVSGRVLPLIGDIARSIIVDGVTGSLFWVWLVALAGGQAMLNKELNRTTRLALLGLMLATLGVGWFQGRSWASGWAPPLVALLVLVWFRSWRLGLVVTLAVGLAGVLVRGPGISASMPIAAPFLDTASFSEDGVNLATSLVAADRYSIDTRWVAWEIVLTKVLPANPILGLGPSNYYHYTRLYPILGWHVNFNSHNQYVDILAQTGILGLATFSWLMLAIGKLGLSLRERVGEGFARGYVYACLAGLTGTLAAGMLGDWFLPFVYNIGLAGFRASVLGWFFLGGLVAIENMPRSQFEHT